MRRLLLRCAVLVGPLVLPTLAGCAPVGLINPVLGLFGHSAPTASASTASAFPSSAESCSTNAVSQASGLLGHPSPAAGAGTAGANPTGAGTTSANPASAGNGSPGFFSPLLGLFGHPSPTASTDDGSANTANPGLIGDHGGGASIVSQAVGAFGNPSPTASGNPATTDPNGADTAIPNPTSTDTPSANPTSADNGSAGTVGADSGHAGFFSRVFGLFGHHASTTSANPVRGNPTDSGSAATASLGTILSMRFVSATNQPGAGTGSATTAMTGAHGGGTSSSFRVAGMGNGAMGMMPATGPDGDGTTGPQSPLRPGPGQATEFTLRMDDGSTLTVVQSDDQGLLPGDWVQLISGEHAHVARAE